MGKNKADKLLRADGTWSGRGFAITAVVISLLVIGGVAAGDGEGTASISPSGVAIAASSGTWTITYTADECGIAPGGGIRLQLSGYPVRLFATPQCDNPKGPNYTTAHCSQANVPLTVRMVRALRHGWQDVQELEVLVGKPGLKAGQKIVVVYGDRSGGGPGGRIRGAEGDDLPVRIYSDTDGDGKFAPLKQFPRITIAGGAASRFVVYAPSQAVVGRPVRVAVSARDHRNALATQAPEKVILSGEGLREPVIVAFKRGRRAVAQAQVVFSRAGVRRIEARPAAAPTQRKTIPREQFVAASRPAAETEPQFRPALTKVVISALAARPGSALLVQAHWMNKGTKPASRPYRFSCHLERRPPKGRALVNWDHMPAFPTTQWAPGKEVVDTYVCPIPADVPSGHHALTIGLYYSPAPGKFVVLVNYEICRIHVGPEQPLVIDMQPAVSNPVEVLDKEPEFKLLWGDIHCHSENSGDASGSLRGLYTYARDVSRLDFCACTDHVGVWYPKEKWQQIQAAARKFNQPGRFVAFLAYEWSNMWHGDKNVYFANDDEDIRVPRSGEAEDLWPMLRGVDCVVIPHHPAYPVGLRGTDWGRIDTALVPVVEMCSNHGIGEYLGNPRPYGKNKNMGPSLPGGFAQDALARGLKLGFICSSDDHTGHPGKSGPIVAVYARQLTRKAILEALRARRCYGTTGARMILRLWANGRPIGSEIECNRPPVLRVQVYGDGPIERVEIVRNGKVCHVRRPSGEICEFEYQDERIDEERVYYYVRVTQRNGHIGWSSPVFIKYIGPRPQLEVEDVRIIKGERLRELRAVVANTGKRSAKAAVAWFMVDGLPAVPVGRERPPVRGGIGGLMLRPGLQVWRWPVDEQSINVFIRWGGDEQARDCSGYVRIVNAAKYMWTPFHAEAGDKYAEEDGVVRWSTYAEAGSGDGLNLWVRIDPRKHTRVEIDFKRAGQRRVGEVFARVPVRKLPLTLDLANYYTAGRWIGEADVPALPPGGRYEVRIKIPTGTAEGKIVWRLMDKESGRLISQGTAGRIGR